MIAPSRSRNLGCPLLEPFELGGFTAWSSFLAVLGDPVSQPNSSTEQSRIP